MRFTWVVLSLGLTASTTAWSKPIPLATLSAVRPVELIQRFNEGTEPKLLVILSPT